KIIFVRLLTIVTCLLKDNDVTNIYTIIIVFFVVRLIRLFDQEGIPERLNLTHSKLLSETLPVKMEQK
ncbi:MAG: hypothetical protein LBE12_08470, partial [Planctomycetaceae bacterium]|nr:hypothetical protein [Planctomycetaceae bacterium]